jgi:hypothetical protein
MRQENSFRDQARSDEWRVGVEEPLGHLNCGAVVEASGLGRAEIDQVLLEACERNLSATLSRTPGEDIEVWLETDSASRSQDVENRAICRVCLVARIEKCLVEGVRPVLLGEEDESLVPSEMDPIKTADWFIRAAYTLAGSLPSNSPFGELVDQAGRKGRAQAGEHLF